MPRTQPNILVSGTPGTGKTTLATRLAEKVQELTYVDFGKEAKERDCREEYDEELECWVIDEEKVCWEMYWSYPISQTLNPFPARTQTQTLP